MESYQRENKLKRIPIILCGWVSLFFFLQFSPLHLMLHEKALLLLYNLEDGYFKLCTLLFYFCSDWNGSKRGHVYKFLRSQGFVSSYDDAHKYTDSDADAHKVCCLQVTILFYYFSALVFTWPLISQTNKANQLLYFFMSISFLMSCSGLATAIIGETSVVLISFGFVILTSHANH